MTCLVSKVVVFQLFFRVAPIAGFGDYISGFCKSSFEFRESTFGTDMIQITRVRVRSYIQMFTKNDMKDWRG